MRTRHITASLLGSIVFSLAAASAQDIGREVSIPRHLQDGEEFSTPLPALIEYGKQLLMAVSGRSRKAAEGR
jgi:hypothetical protein